MKVCVIGAGIMGTTIAFLLAKQGVDIDLYEAGNGMGGLAATIQLPDGTAVDRFYHTIHPGKTNILNLIESIGLQEQLQFKRAYTAIYAKNAFHAMNGPFKLLRFRAIPLKDRLNLFAPVVYANAVINAPVLRKVSLQSWILDRQSLKAYREIWEPLYSSRLDYPLDKVPATYFRTTLTRTMGNRKDENEGEWIGHLRGGYGTLIKEMAAYIQEMGHGIKLGTPVDEVVTEDGRVRGIRLGGETVEYDAVVLTTQLPIVRRLVPGAPQDFLNRLDQIPYVGIICPLVVLDRPLSANTMVHVADAEIPFSSVVETSHVMGVDETRGHHFVYLPKYINGQNPWLRRSDGEVREEWLRHLRRMFPEFRDESIQHFIVNRGRFIDPIHLMGRTEDIPEVQTPIEGMYLSTTAQVFPDWNTAESVIQLAQKTARMLLQL